MSLSILCVGLPRTGTTSLVKALNLLGLRAIHFHPEKLLAVGRRCDWRVYDDVDAAADFPASPYYREILQEYPEARCILTLREPREAWMNSVLGHGEQMHGSLQQDKGYLQFMRAVGREWWGGELGSDLRGALSRYYDYWTARVQEDIPADRLLVLRIANGDGWEPLCRFLELPVPLLVPFPHELQRPPKCE